MAVVLTYFAECDYGLCAEVKHFNISSQMASAQVAKESPRELEA